VVTVKSQTIAVAADATGQNIVVISSSVQADKVGNKFTKVTVPLLTWEYALYDDLGMATAPKTTASQTQIAIVSAAHPLAAGLSGHVTVHSTGYAVPSGVPNSKAMPGLTAPAHCVAFFFNSVAGGTLTNDAWKLFAAAVNWASPTPLPTYYP
jgi:hypothetical protein